MINKYKYEIPINKGELGDIVIMEINGIGFIQPLVTRVKTFNYE